MGTAGRVKNQSMVLVDDRELDRLDALRLVMGVSRAEVIRIVIKGKALDELEHEHDAALRSLRTIAASVALDVNVFVSRLVSGRQKTPTLADLEHMSVAQIKEELRIPTTA